MFSPHIYPFFTIPKLCLIACDPFKQYIGTLKLITKFSIVPWFSSIKSLILEFGTSVVSITFICIFRIVP